MTSKIVAAFIQVARSIPIKNSSRSMGNLISQFKIGGVMDRGGSDGGAGAASALDLDENALKKNVEDLVNDARIVIFSKESCPHCYNTKSVFDKLGATYSVVEIDQHPQTNSVQEILCDMTGARTVPRVFIDGKCIGGNTDTVNLFNTGELQQMLSINPQLSKSKEKLEE